MPTRLGKNPALSTFFNAMKILERRHTWLHTHFLTDCERLPPHRMREIEEQIVPVLRQFGIVYDIHFDAHRDDPGVRIVLECIPLPNTLELIQLELARIVQPIPARPRERHIVAFDRAASEETRSPAKGFTTTPPEVEAEG
ncbi:MAG TPA: hypothetical protein VNP04_32140 [Alphaproteobacteria bacterium]|nr:hypothetical protein [Alphaproteobacteria bacterium]